MNANLNFNLTDNEIFRYSRHIILPQIGVVGQKKLKAAKVLIVGTGGLGSPIALYLAAAGVGTVGLADFDEVDESNLQRQVIHSIKDIGKPKTASAKDKIKNINQYVNIVEHNEMLTAENSLDIIANYDIVADGTDNFQTRYLLNDACVLLGKPLVYGSVSKIEGQASVFYAKDGPCYRCLYPEPPPPEFAPSCSESGVLGVLPGIIGSIQANEVIKLVIGDVEGSPSAPEPLIGRLLLFNAWEMRFRELKIEKDEHCPICGKEPSICELIDYEQFCGIKKASGEPIESLTVRELKERIDSGSPLQIIDAREPHERAIYKFPNAKVISLGEMASRMAELDPAIDAVLVCELGQKSAFAIRDLREAGYKGRLFHLKNGVKAWVREAG